MFWSVANCESQAESKVTAGRISGGKDFFRLLRLGTGSALRPFSTILEDADPFLSDIVRNQSHEYF